MESIPKQVTEKYSGDPAVKLYEVADFSHFVSKDFDDTSTQRKLLELKLAQLYYTSHLLRQRKLEMNKFITRAKVAGNEANSACSRYEHLTGQSLNLQKKYATLEWLQKKIRSFWGKKHSVWMK